MSSSRISQRLFKLTDVDDFLKWASDDRVTRAHISFVVGIDYWGQGIVTTALKIAVSKVFKEFPADLLRIEAKVDVENKGSQKVLENVGFLKEGLLRKSICIDDRSIGFVIIMPRSGDDQCRADVGRALSAEYWGHGIATRAVKMAINEGLKEFPDVIRLQAYKLWLR
ncbi:putative n-acetyltransferase p20 [Fagus crenata]